MQKTAMDYTKEAMERSGMVEEINKLRTQLANMQSDFAQCAKGKSPCFFCVNDDTCESENECSFVWAEH